MWCRKRVTTQSMAVRFRYPSPSAGSLLGAAPTVRLVLELGHAELAPSHPQIRATATCARQDFGAVRDRARARAAWLGNILSATAVVAFRANRGLTLRRMAPADAPPAHPGVMRPAVAPSRALVATASTTCWTSLQTAEIGGVSLAQPGAFVGATVTRHQSVQGSVCGDRRRACPARWFSCPVSNPPRVSGHLTTSSPVNFSKTVVT